MAPDGELPSLLLPQKNASKAGVQLLWGAVRAAVAGRLDAREARTKIESMLFALATTHY
jgi:hypothetical protein